MELAIIEAVVSKDQARLDQLAVMAAFHHDGERFERILTAVMASLPTHDLQHYWLEEACPCAQVAK